MATNQYNIFFQDLATVILLEELNNNDLLNSDFYNKMDWGNEESNKKNIKIILSDSGLGNPAMLQMLLYALLIMPKEVISKNDMKIIENEVNQFFNDYIDNNIKYNICSTYKNEKNIKDINFYRHIRNAVAHSRCYYEDRWDVCSVRFEDKNPKNNAEKSEIEIPTYVAGGLLDLLKIELMKFLNKNIQNVGPAVREK